jgi:NAD(P)-dependent dehydrogenase (short-subunit alcohol dehydrogenase family)
MSNADWTVEKIPNLNGKTVIITGANSGLGYETARALSRASAKVVFACRNETTSVAAMARIRAEQPAAALTFLPLDLSSLGSVRAFARRFAEGHERLDLLLNNAGVMALPYRKTADGFEMQFGTNHLGHFALTGLLLPLLARAPSARVVTVSSQAHRMGAINFDDLASERSYQRWLAYGQSKLANLLFAYELERRIEAHGLPVKSVAAHPGFSATELGSKGPQMEGASFTLLLNRWMNQVITQSAAMGALPTLFAATAPEVHGGDYIGPDGPFEMQGHPVKVQSNARSHDLEVARRLWEVSEQLTSVRYDAAFDEAKAS